MTPLDLLALNVYEEAGGEPDDGKAAIALVVKNRMRLKFFSDGTIPGTVLRRDQFSWAWFHFVTKTTGTIAAPTHVQVYERAARSFDQAAAIAEQLLKKVPAPYFAHCQQIAQAVLDGNYRGDAFDTLTPEVVSYCNPKILTRLPSWAIPKFEVSVIGHHHFYREAVPEPVAV